MADMNNSATRVMNALSQHEPMHCFLPASLSTDAASVCSHRELNSGSFGLKANVLTNIMH